MVSAHHVDLTYNLGQGRTQKGFPLRCGYIYIYIYVPLSHLRSKGKASAYILYCTGSGMLTRYTHCGQCNIKILHRISRYSIPKNPKKLSDSFEVTLDCMLVYIKY